MAWHIGVGGRLPGSAGTDAGVGNARSMNSGSDEILVAALAAPKGGPFQCGQDNPFPAETAPIDEAWRRRLRGYWWSTSYHGPLDPKIDHDLLTLRDALIGFGGQEACMPAVEDNLAGLLRRGQIWPGSPYRKLPYGPGRCTRIRRISGSRRRPPASTRSTARRS